MRTKRKKLGEALVADGLVTEDEVRGALAEHKRTGERLGAVLIRLNLATERQIAQALAVQLGLPFVDFGETAPDPDAVALISKDIALQRLCLPLRLERNTLTLAMADPLFFSVVQDLEFQTGRYIKQAVATRSDILEAIGHAYPDNALTRTATNAASSTDDDAASFGIEAAPAEKRTVHEPVDTLRERSQAAPIIDLVDLVLKSAITNAASDIHIEPMEPGVLIRHRLDGLLKEVMDLPKWVHEGLIARMKILAGMDIAEKRLPQDGRIRVNTDDGRQVDFRASTLRTLHGEKMVLRMLDNRRGAPPLEELGFSPGSLSTLRDFLRNTHGMILVVGPTGSGKTTTLCSALSSIQSEQTNIITVEDPIEYQLVGINQTQIQERIHLTFAAALRSILRQDPDVILVGEIRDQETARIAMQAAQTGHLVLSTLHTDDAPSSITRLIDIGIESYVIASAVIGVVAQRLMRRLCPNCRKQYTPPPDILRMLGITEAEAATIRFFKAGGCEQCRHTGYRGRVGIYEVMRVTDKMRRLVTDRASEDAIGEAARSGGMASLSDDALAKVKAGLTTPEELLRVVSEVQAADTACSGCGATVGSDFIVCPTCGKRLSDSCPGCARAMEPGWTFCPYCARNTAQSPSKHIRNRKACGSMRNVTEFKKALPV